mmetsp:Transcript_6072/g.7454  ORF Transcript_6072/g.7454 Transcript_6072/m.7454 type:complete len:113 (+) Transcript_6072:143-481(+)
MVSPTSISCLDSDNETSQPFSTNVKSLPSNPPPSATSGGRRIKFRPKITVDTSSGGRSLYFPCGKPPPTQQSPDIDSDSSSSPNMVDTNAPITLTRTGYVDDVVTPFFAQTS